MDNLLGLHFAMAAALASCETESPSVSPTREVLPNGAVMEGGYLGSVRLAFEPARGRIWVQHGNVHS